MEELIEKIEKLKPHPTGCFGEYLLHSLYIEIKRKRGEKRCILQQNKN